MSLKNIGINPFSWYNYHYKNNDRRFMPCP